MTVNQEAYFCGSSTCAPGRFRQARDQVPKIQNVPEFLQLLFLFSFQLTGEATLQIASNPVLPFNALDIALEIQKNLKGNFFAPESEPR